MKARAERTNMRRTTAAAWIALGSLAAGCAPALDRISPQLPEYRLAILVRPVAGVCRTTTIPAFALVTSRQVVTWEVISTDRAACDPGAVRIEAKPVGRAATAAATPAAGAAQSPATRPAFDPARGQRPETWIVRNLRPGRYQYNVIIGGETEDPEIEVWR
jgi:hypothetical protein